MSDKTEWTPGPYIVGSLSGHNPNYIYAAGDNTVASVFGLPVHSHLDRVKQDPMWAEGLATAHLFAAAPELYKALDAMLERYTGLVNCGDCGNWDPEEEEPVIAARAALAKARGV